MNLVLDTQESFKFQNYSLWNGICNGQCDIFIDYDKTI